LVRATTRSRRPGNPRRHAADTRSLWLSSRRWNSTSSMPIEVCVSAGHYARSGSVYAVLPECCQRS
jgi:hypothetical protein